MSKKYTRKELKEIGMNDKQIQAIMDTYAAEEHEAGEEESRKEYLITEFPTKKPNTKKTVRFPEASEVTTISDLQSYANGTIVRFPDFAEGQPFVARVRRPSMLVLAKQGKIPNKLLSSANSLFTKGGSGVDSDNDNMLSDIYSITEIMCEAALIEPTYQQIKDAGIELSDDQLMAIFNYTQTGVKALDSFR